MSAEQSRRRRNNNNPSNPFDGDAADNDASYASSVSGRRSAGGGSRGGGGGGGSNPFGDDDGDDDDDEVMEGATTSETPPHDPLLDHYERRLRETVDPDFFHDPADFTALDRVVSIIGAEILQSGGNITPGSVIATDFSHLPSYRNIAMQRTVVEEAIEHMAVRHCADLNSSVSAVGRMSRQFDEAKVRVRNLRKQVVDVRDSLRLGEAGGVGGGGGGNGIAMINGAPSNDPASSSANPNEPSNNNASAAAAAAAQAGASARSLRELWLKKLECEAVLSLLRKLEIIRRAPSGFDMLIRPVDGGPCKIGAAVVVLSEALSIMFSDDVAMVQAFDRIVEQLMTRKQRAEEILWATLVDVLYRHGDGQGSKEEERRRRERMERRARALEAAVARGETAGSSASAANNLNMSTIAEYSDEDETNSYTHTNNSFEDDLSTKSGTPRGGGGGNSTASGANSAATPSNNSGAGSSVQFKRMVGRAILESDIDLEGDELRCLEEPAAWGGTTHSIHTHLPASYLYPEQALPRYTDPILALRILVECLTKLKRLDDVEQYLSEGMVHEIRQVAEREQAKTVARLERQRGRAKLSTMGDGNGGGEGGGGDGTRGGGGDDMDNLKEFRIHLSSLLKAFGGVMTRFLHLAQILRHKICSDTNLEKMCPSYPIPSSALIAVLVNAELAMQREIKLFISACIAESDKPKDKRRRMHNGMSMDQSQLDVESGIFSLGITSSALGGGPSSMNGWKKSRANIVDLPPDQFVSNFLIPRTNVEPEVRHALTFRRSISQWSHEMSEGRRELAICSGEDTTSPMYYNTAMEDSALVYVDNIIQRTLLPEMQDEAVNAVIHFLERHDAFDPIANDAFTRYQHHTLQVEAEMSVACQALYTSTRPIFMALHRLPKGGDMYLSLVTMLEHAMLTFISRMKQRVGEVCQGKAAFSFLEDKRGNPTPLSQYMERRNAFTLLQRIYNDEDDVDDTTEAVEPTITPHGGILPLAPSESDTTPRNNGKLTGADGRGTFERELAQITVLTRFSGPLEIERSTLCTDDELMKAACLANSLLRVASLLDGQLRNRGDGWDKSQKIKAVRDLQSAIKTIRYHGLRVAKFCRMEMLIQTAMRMSEICMSSVLQAEDAIRLPSCVNNLGEYLTSSSDNIREAGGNAIAAFSFSSLEQYIPFYLMHSARIVAGRLKPITINGIVSLDRTGSVLYRDLKGATSFENSFWDEEAAANSFEQSAVFISLLEISLNDLEAHYRSNPTQFTDEDYQLMFAFTGPRRRGDARRFELLKSKMKTERKKT